MAVNLRLYSSNSGSLDSDMQLIRVSDDAEYKHTLSEPDFAGHKKRSSTISSLIDTPYSKAISNYRFIAFEIPFIMVAVTSESETNDGSSN